MQRPALQIKRAVNGVQRAIHHELTLLCLGSTNRANSCAAATVPVVRTPGRRGARGQKNRDSRDRCGSDAE